MNSSHNDGGTLVRLAGVIDDHEITTVRSAFAVARDGDPVTVDLSEVAFIDSAGLGALIGCIRRIRDAGGVATLVAPNAAMRELLRITGVDRVAHVRTG
jgi:anti-sigma B factor antagonist